MALIDAQSSSRATYGVGGVQNGGIESGALKLVLLMQAQLSLRLAVPFCLFIKVQVSPLRVLNFCGDQS